MANYGKRLPWVTGSPEHEPNKLTELEWTKLERILGCSITVNARDQIETIRKGYALRRTGELYAASEKDVQRQAKLVLEQVAGFNRFAMNCGNDIKGIDSSSNQWKEFEKRLDDWLQSRPIPIAGRSLIISGRHIDGELEDTLDFGHVRLALDLHILMEIAITLSAGLDAIEKGSVKNDDFVGVDGFDPGLAYDRMILAIIDWAKTNQLPTQLRTSDAQIAGPLANFAFELFRMFEAPIAQTQMASATALAKKMDRVTSSR